MKKDTHSMQDVEGLILEKLDILKNGETKKEKNEARRAIINLEKFHNDITNKKINGKKYPIKEKPPKISKEELLKLIDSVEPPEHNQFRLLQLQTEQAELKGLDLSGVSVGKNRFEFIE